MAKDKKEHPKEPPAEKDGDIGRDPGSGGFFVPPLWLGKVIKFARGK
jgi:hypothetical protein